MGIRFLEDADLCGQKDLYLCKYLHLYLYISAFVFVGFGGVNEGGRATAGRGWTLAF